MCYYVASKLSAKEIYSIEHDFVLKWEEEERNDYYAVSGFAHPKLPVITSEKRFRNYRWGLIPPWTKDWEDAKKRRVQCLNCIGEEMEGKPSFQGAVKARQFCVVPVNGFYEWHHKGTEKYPHFIYPKDKSLFYLAGIYQQWTNKPIDEAHDTFSVVTVAANERMEWIHNSKKRMPNILTANEAQIWLDPGVSFTEKKKLIDPFDMGLMADHPVSKLITSRKENPNQPEVMQPFEYADL